jgi:hypothetical protein
MPRFPLADYAATEALHADPRLKADPILIAHMLAWCDRLGQFWEFEGGFVAWLRCRWESVPLFEERNFRLAYELDDIELTTGPVLWVSDALSLIPGQVSTATHALREIPGVEGICAHIGFGARPGWALESVADETTLQLP